MRTHGLVSNIREALVHSMQTQARRFFWALLLVGCASTASALSIYSTLGLDVSFERMGVALNAGERAKIAGALDRIRAEDWCTFEVAIVVGHADPSEKPSSLQSLSELRAAYVANLLEEYGVPKKRIYQEGKGARQPGSHPSGRVEVDFKGGIGSVGCEFPAGAGGFRVWD
jgi:outer membrane protein OmpA-like peptidoglycan-associated protein